MSGLAFDRTIAARAHARDNHRGIADFERQLIQERIRSDNAAAKPRGKRLGRQKGQRPKSYHLAPRVLALVEKGRSYSLIGRAVGLSKNTMAGIVKRTRQAAAAPDLTQPRERLACSFEQIMRHPQ